MKLKMNREQLLKPLQMITGVVERKQTSPILANCLIDASGDSVWITGTDQEIQVSSRMALDDSGEIVEAGRLTASSWKLLEVVRSLREGASVELVTESERLVLKSDRSRFTLATLPVTDFPAADQVEGTAGFQIEPAQLLEVIQKTAFAMANQDVRYYLNGLLLELQQGQLKAVATDGHRLACSSSSAAIDLEVPQQMIVPRKAVQELGRILRECTEPVTLRSDQRHLGVESSEFNFLTKLIDGRFPDYRGVIPTHDQLMARVERDAMRQALIQAGKLVNEKYRGVRLEFVQDGVKISASNPDQEQAEIEIAVEYSGESIEIGFNIQYLLDVFSVTGGEFVKVWLGDANSSVRIEEEDDSNTCYVVMPMML